MTGDELLGDPRQPSGVTLTSDRPRDETASINPASSAWSRTVPVIVVLPSWRFELERLEHRGIAGAEFTFDGDLVSTGFHALCAAKGAGGVH